MLRERNDNSENLKYKNDIECLCQVPMQQLIYFIPLDRILPLALVVFFHYNTAKRLNVECVEETAAVFVKEAFNNISGQHKTAVELVFLINTK